MQLLEREPEFEVLHAALRGALTGQGAIVAVGGESGSGKSVLVEKAGARYAGLRRLRGHCDPLGTPRPLGPIRDVARAAGFAPAVAAADAALAEVCEGVYHALQAEPTVLVVEDLHWADAASVDVLRFLTRRLDVLPLALLLTYRDDEVPAGHPARGLLGDLARTDAATTIRLDPLSEQAVRTLVADSGLDPRRVHALTGGNPFFVDQVLKEPDRPLPSTVRDAVLARTSTLTAEDVEVLQLVAAAPDRLDDRLLPALGVDLPTLRRLDGTGLLVRSRGGLVFRHELARQAVESTVPAGGGPRLHARVLDALERVEPVDPAVLTHHAVEAKDRVRAAHWARLAAAEAARAGAHTEAAAFFTTALEHLPDAGAAERAELLAQLSYQQYMTSRLTPAIANIRATFPLRQLLGDNAGLAKAHETCAVYEYYDANRREAEAQAGRAAILAVDTTAAAVSGDVCATRGYLSYMRSDLEGAEANVRQAAQVADQVDHPVLRLRSSMLHSTLRLAGGDLSARESLAEQIELARAQHWDELASTGYSQLATIDVEQRRFRSAERVLERSLPFAVERDIPICQHWQTAVRSRLHLAEGLWDAALEDAEWVLTGPGMMLAELWPRIVTGLVTLRRGGPVDTVTGHLDAAWDLAGRLDEPLRRFPVHSALAEAMWMTGREDERVTRLAVGELGRRADTPGLDWARGDLVLWLRRLGLLSEVVGPVAEPHRRELAGEAAGAAAWWQQAGEPFASAMALADSADADDRSRAVELLDRLGAAATADRLRVDLRRDGVARIPARPRGSTRANPSGLTNRQLDVAKLVARGYTNAEIASRLYISPKTTDHHVSAVLTKMGLPNRRAMLVRAEEFGLV